MKSIPVNDKTVSIYLGTKLKAEVLNHCDSHKPRPIPVSRYIAGLVRSDLKKKALRAEIKGGK